MKATKQSWLLTGGLLTAVAASLCCLGPLVAVALGFGTLAAAGWLESWRPLFLVGTVGFLAAAWWLTLRARRAACADGSCVSASSRRRTLGMLIGGTVIVSALAVFPQIAGVVAGYNEHGQAAAAGAQVLRVRIPTMDCAACAVGIERTLRRVEGVRSASVSYESKQAEIVYDPAVATPAALIARIDATGFRAEAVK